MRLIIALAIGAVFGLGISVSGMGNPAKVLNFFDIAGTWDPSLAFVMGGALTVTFIGYRLVLGRPRPVCADSFQLPTKTQVDRRLVAGSAVFGVGWGIAGFCPGGSLPMLGTGLTDVFIFVAALCAGLAAARLLDGVAKQSGGRDALSGGSVRKT
ncbi:permease [Acuticoccus sediminis]|uniref:Permease n=1 Tax=Acuticoccus sediminis TaxID=2184697 RepID=A0A8B2NZ08_9HYPH|nr:YeeE/YedE family protein [Acuticoccus sediminis]RAI03960.1 permease [Acuticoccus sediminis]